MRYEIYSIDAEPLVNSGKINLTDIAKYIEEWLYSIKVQEHVFVTWIARAEFNLTIIGGVNLYAQIQELRHQLYTDFGITVRAFTTEVQEI